jgi:hypothetical protein
MEKYPILKIVEVNIVGVHKLFKVIYRLSSIPFNVPKAFSTETEK